MSSVSQVWFHLGPPGYVLRADNASPGKAEEKLSVENQDPLRYLDSTSPQEERRRNQGAWKKLDSIKNTVQGGVKKGRFGLATKIQSGLFADSGIAAEK